MAINLKKFLSRDSTKFKYSITSSHKQKFNLVEFITDSVTCWTKNVHEKKKKKKTAKTKNNSNVIIIIIIIIIIISIIIIIIIMIIIKCFDKAFLFEECTNKSMYYTFRRLGMMAF